MKRLNIRPRSLVLVAALAVVAAMCTVSTANAASSASAAPHDPAASSTPCNFVPSLKTCTSTDPTVGINAYYYGNNSGCTYVWNINWGDRSSPTTVTQTSPPDGDNFLANHKYAKPGTYTIMDTGQVTAGSCTVATVVHIFTLAASSPKGHVRPQGIFLCTQDHLNGALKFLPDCQAIRDCAEALSPLPTSVTDILKQFLSKAEKDALDVITIAQGCGEIACKYQPPSFAELLGLPWYTDETVIERQFECAGLPSLFIKGGGLYLGTPTGKNSAPL